MLARSGTTNSPLISDTKVLEKIYLSLKKVSGELVHFIQGSENNQETSKTPRGRGLGAAVMPAIWVINPLCLSRGWGLIRTVIMLGMNGTSGAIRKGVADAGASTSLRVSLLVNTAISHTQFIASVLVSTQDLPD